MEYQNIKEFTSLAKIVRDLVPMRTLEIGSMYGDSLLWWMMFSARPGKVMSIDLPLPPSDARYHRQQAAYATWDLWADVMLVDFISIKGNSHDASSVAKAKEELGYIDFLFIDGDHTYEGVKKDFELYSPFVRQGGMIAFHDITKSSASFVKVHEFWEETKRGYKYDEFRFDSGQYGIGVLYV